MSGPDWYRWYPSKWLAGTLGLTNEQRGVYIQIINVIYDRGSCPADEAYLKALCNCHVRALRRIIGELIAIGKIAKVGQNYEQTRAKLERKEAETFVENQRNRALKRWHNNGLADANDGITQPQPQPHEGLGRNIVTLSPTPESSSAPLPGAKKGSRLPDDWKPSPAQIAYARSQGLDPQRTAEDFRDYWLSKPGKDGIKLDWDRTWQTWCRNAADRKARFRGGFQRDPPRAPSSGVDRIAELLAVGSKK